VFNVIWTGKGLQSLLYTRSETSDDIGYVHQTGPETSDGIGSMHGMVVDVWISNWMMDRGSRANPTEV
jgi:hypothetical protein